MITQSLGVLVGCDDIVGALYGWRANGLDVRDTLAPLNCRGMAEAGGAAAAVGRDAEAGRGGMPRLAAAS